MYVTCIAIKVNIRPDKGYDDHIMAGLLDWDKTHLNQTGYHILMRKTLLSLSVNLYEARAQMRRKRANQVIEMKMRQKKEEMQAKLKEVIAQEKPVPARMTHRHRRTLSKHHKNMGMD